VLKHLRTEVEGSRKRRIYDAPATPFQQLKACAVPDKEQIAALENLYRTLDPLARKEAIETKLRRVAFAKFGRPFSKRSESAQTRLVHKPAALA
jgi:hypothetical protein